MEIYDFKFFSKIFEVNLRDNVMTKRGQTMIYKETLHRKLNRTKRTPHTPVLG
jgi:hypothetical protein